MPRLHLATAALLLASQAGFAKNNYQPPSPMAARPAVKPSEPRIVTECKDGSVSVGGDCK